MRWSRSLFRRRRKTSREEMILALVEVEKNISIVTVRENRMLNLVEHKSNIEEILSAVEEVRGSL